MRHNNSNNKIVLISFIVAAMITLSTLGIGIMAADLSNADTELLDSTPRVSNIAEGISEPVDILPAVIEITKVKIDGPDIVETHSKHYWTLLITITNTGESSANDVIVKDVLPAELGLTDYTASMGCLIHEPTGEVMSGASHLTWELGTLAPDESATLSLEITTLLNPGGNQEFTSPGNYSLNDGAWATANDTATGQEISAGPTEPIIVTVFEVPEEEPEEPIEDPEIPIENPEEPVDPVVDPEIPDPEPIVAGDLSYSISYTDYVGYTTVDEYGIYFGTTGASMGSFVAYYDGFLLPEDDHGIYPMYTAMSSFMNFCIIYHICTSHDNSNIIHTFIDHVPAMPAADHNDS